jgi:hypothetical protein
VYIHQTIETLVGFGVFEPKRGREGNLPEGQSFLAAANNWAGVR